jgi:DNA-binding PucR family transcriptional regulator
MAINDTFVHVVQHVFEISDLEAGGRFGIIPFSEANVDSGASPQETFLGGSVFGRVVSFCRSHTTNVEALQLCHGL